MINTISIVNVTPKKVLDILTWVTGQVVVVVNMVKFGFLGKEILNKYLYKKSASVALFNFLNHFNILEIQLSVLFPFYKAHVLLQSVFVHHLAPKNS